MDLRLREDLGDVAQLHMSGQRQVPSRPNLRDLLREEVCLAKQRNKTRNRLSAFGAQYPRRFSPAEMPASWLVGVSRQRPV